MRALRADNARLESRLDKLEQGLTIAAPKPLAPTPATKVVRAEAKPAMEELPALTVVKLKPKREAPTKVATSIAVEEPPETVLTELAAAKPKAADDDEAPVADAQYERALDSIKTGNVEKGIEQLQQFATEWPRHPHADNALYFAGIGLMNTKDFEGAAKAFDDVTRRYPAGDAVLDALLKSAECRHKLNRPNEARAVYQQIVSSYPGTAAATQAQARLIEPR